MGLDAKLTEQEELRMRMSSRWRKQNPVEFGNRYKKNEFYHLWFGYFIGHLRHLFSQILLRT